MNILRLLLVKSLFIVCLFSPFGFTDNVIWPDNKKAAVVLTYDDTLASHIDNALPELNKRKLTATFYLSGARAELSKNMPEWRLASKMGHELGNHTLFHPCMKSKPERDWVLPHLDLDKYSIPQFIQELETTNTLLKAIDGKSIRTFAYTCGDKRVNNMNIDEYIKPLFIAARDVLDEENKLSTLNKYSINAFDGSNKSAEELISIVEKAKNNQSLVVFVFHGVGGDYLTIDNKTHKTLLDHLVKNSDDFWVAPLINVVQYINSQN